MKGIHMLYIDTNALYYAAGVSQHNGIDIEKLKYTVQSECIAISSTSIYEFIMKYKSDLSTIHKLGQYINDNEIKPVFSDFFPQVDSYAFDLSSISEKDFKKLVHEVKNLKVNIESKYTNSVFCMCLFSGIYFSLSKGDTISSFAIEIVRIAMKFAAEVGQTAFRQYYIDGYTTDDCEKYIKISFSNLLGFLLQNIIPFVQEADKLEGEIDVNDFLDKNNWIELSEKIGKQLNRVPISTSYLQKIAIKYWKAENDDHLTQFFKKFSGTIDKYQEAALKEYISEIMKKCCIEGGSFKKNDILDAIILCHIKEDHQLITFDTGIQKHMKKYKDEKEEYNDSLNIIASFYI